MDRNIRLDFPRALQISEDDAYEAMRDFGAYLDISPGDFRDLYIFACGQVQKKLLREVKARDIMTTPPLLLQCGMTLRSCIDFLEGHGISGAPVVNGDGSLAGIISEKDIVFALCGLSGITPMGMLQAMLSQHPDPAKLESPVDGVMTRDVCSVSPDTPLEDMLSLMHGRSINRLPVMDVGRAAGIVTRTDLLKVFGSAQ